MSFFAHWPRTTSKYWSRGLAVGFVVVLISWMGLFDSLERWNTDLFFSLRGQITPLTPLVIVSIDENSFDEFDLAWPWPRALHAELMDRIRQGDPTVVGIDIAFPEPSIRGPEDDQKLAEALARAGNVILAAPMTIVRDSAYMKEDLNAPIKSLRERAAGFGYTNFALENDASIRTSELSRQFQNQEIPSFPLAIYQVAIKRGLNAQPLKDRTFLINFRGGPHSFQTIPYYQVLRGEVGADVFRDKIVLVGATSPLLHDVFPAPFAAHGDMAGVEIHANVLENLVQGISLQRMPHGIGYVLACLAGVVAVWLTFRLAPLAALGGILVIALAYGAAVFFVFSRGLIVMDTTVVMIPLLLGYGVTVIESFIIEKRQRGMLMQLFSRHVSPEVADAIWQQREAFLTGGRIRPQSLVASVLFTDLKGFTSISERMDSTALLDWINDYMEVMAQLVMKHGGVVDDYYGDAIKANFGVPFKRTTETEIAQDAVNAVECALAMKEELKRLNDLWHKQGLPMVGIRIGIFTGEVVAGCVGSTQRMKFTTIGDAVNTASRLESFEKERDDRPISHDPCRILIGAVTCTYLGDQFLTPPYGQLSLKGKAHALTVYEVIGRHGDPCQTRYERNDLRKALRIEVSGRAMVSNGFHADALVGNLSVGGLAMSKLPHAIDIGKSAQLTFELSGLRQPIQARGIVVWTAQDQAGFALQEVSEADRLLLEEFIAQQS
jgi:adenylate cyclase